MEQNHEKWRCRLLTMLFTLLGGKKNAILLIVGAVIVAVVGGYIVSLKLQISDLRNDNADLVVEMSEKDKKITNLNAKIEIINNDLVQANTEIEDSNDRLEAIAIDRDQKMAEFATKQKSLEKKLKDASAILNIQSSINDLNITTPQQKAKVLDAVRAIDVLYGFGRDGEQK